MSQVVVTSFMTMDGVIPSTPGFAARVLVHIPNRS